MSQTPFTKPVPSFVPGAPRFAATLNQLSDAVRETQAVRIALASKHAELRSDFDEATVEVDEADEVVAEEATEVEPEKAPAPARKPRATKTAA